MAMKSWIVVAICLGAVANALPSYPVHPGVGAIYKGPNSETIIEGPDGSVITAEAEGGAVGVNLQSNPIVVAEPQYPIFNGLPVEPQNVIISEEVVSKISGPSLVVGKIAEPLSAQSSVAITPKSDNNADLVGPSGSISTRGSNSVVSGPASTTYSGPYGVVSVPKPIETKTVPDTIVLQKTIIQDAGPVYPDGPIYPEPFYPPGPPEFFENPPLPPPIPDGPVFVDEQIARDHLLVRNGPIYPPNSVYREDILPPSALNGGYPIYAQYAPSVFINRGPAITRVNPVLTTIPVASILDTAPIYAPPKVGLGVAVAKGSISTVSTSSVDIVHPSPYLAAPIVKEPYIINKW